MQNKNFVDLTKNDATTSGNEKKKQKKELEQFLVQAQNPLKSIMQNMEKNLELTKISFWVRILIRNKKLFQKRQLKSIVVTRTTVLQTKLMLKR